MMSLTLVVFEGLLLISVVMGQAHAGSHDHSVPTAMAANSTNAQSSNSSASQQTTQTESAKLANMGDSEEIIDLSHPLDSKTIFWPTDKPFSRTDEYNGEVKLSNKTYHYFSDNITMSIHTGTHIDAPAHFSKNGRTVDQIPLKNLVSLPICVIDVSHKLKGNRSFEITKSDLQIESAEPLANTVILCFTGLSESYAKGPVEYMGTNTSKIDEMKIPGLSDEAADFLVQQKVLGFGIDAPSADSSLRHGKNNSFDPVAHEKLLSNDIYIIENINSNLKQLINQSDNYRLSMLPLPIVGGSGSPVRLVATKCVDSGNAPNSAGSVGLRGLSYVSILAMPIMMIALIQLLKIRQFE